MTNMDAMPIYGKNLLLQNHWASCLQTQYVACGELILQKSYKWWPWIDLTLFFGKVKFSPLGMWIEKVHFLVVIVLFDTTMHQNLTLIEFWRSRSLGDLGQRSYVSCLLTFSKGFSYETFWPVSFKLHIQPPSKEGKNVYIFFVQVTWPRWPPCPYME